MLRILIILFIVTILIMVLGKLLGTFIKKFAGIRREHPLSDSKPKSQFDKNKIVEAEFEEVK